MALLDTFPLDARPYGFEWLRYAMLARGLQEGVADAGDFKVTAAAAGGQRVDVAGGVALVQGDSGTRNGLYVQVNDASIANAVTLAASDATNPRVDQIILTVNDSNDLASGGDTPTLSVVAGTPTSGATLDNRSGAGALPANALRLADVLVPAGSTAVTAGNIRDRRPWARGARRRITRTANAGGTNDYTVTTGSGDLDATNLRPRLECSGAPVRLALHGNRSIASGQSLYLRTRYDGAILNGVRGQHEAVGVQPVNYVDESLVPGAGSHLFSVDAILAAGAGTALIYARSDIALVLTVEEDLRASADNS